MGKAEDSGKAFLEQVLAKLPENLREQARTAFTAPEATDAVTLLGDGTLARSDYSKHMDEARTLKEKAEAFQASVQADFDRLNEWYEPRKALLDRYPSLDEVEKAIAAAKTDPIRTGKETTVAGLTKEDLDKILAERDQGYAGVLAATTTMATKHLRDFNETLDMGDLIAFATQKRMTLDQAYRAKFGEKLDAKAKAEEDARIQKLVDERLSAERKKYADQPFPLRNLNPSVLDVLESKEDKPANHTVDTALAEYERLQSLRG